MTPERAQNAEESPLHGYRGAATPPPMLERPRGLTVAISREAGARGTSIAHAIGRLLGWQVYPQDMLDFLAHDDTARAEMLKDLPEAAIHWAALQAAGFQSRRNLPDDHDGAAAARLIFALAARGEAVVVGRGAGFILPKETTVHVRIVAPVAVRTAYLAQWLRQTDDEAAAEAASRDRRRASFIRTMTDIPLEDVTAYDLVLNSARLNPESVAQVIAEAVRTKQLETEAARSSPFALDNF